MVTPARPSSTARSHVAGDGDGVDAGLEVSADKAVDDGEIDGVGGLFVGVAAGIEPIPRACAEAAQAGGRGRAELIGRLPTMGMHVNNHLHGFPLVPSLVRGPVWRSSRPHARFIGLIWYRMPHSAGKTGDSAL